MHWRGRNQVLGFLLLLLILLVLLLVVEGARANPLNRFSLLGLTSHDKGLLMMVVVVILLVVGDCMTSLDIVVAVALVVGHVELIRVTANSLFLCL